MSPARSLGLTLLATLVASSAILAANWHFDPFSLKQAGTANAAPAEGRAILKEPFWYKSFAVTSIRPAGLILGTSRADWALDAAHPGFADGARPVYNLALPGASIDQLRELLVHAQRTRALRQVVL